VLTLHVYPRAVAPCSSCRSPTTCESNGKVFDCRASSASGRHSPLLYIFRDGGVSSCKVPVGSGGLSVTRESAADLRVL